MSGVCKACQQPPCDAPWLLFASTSASKSKCGYPEFYGYESTPPKFFLDKLFSRAGTADFAGDGITTSAAVNEDKHSIIDHLTCAETILVDTASSSRTRDGAIECSDPSVFCWGGLGGGAAVTVTTNTTQTITDDFVYGPPNSIPGTSTDLSTLTLSVEYTTDDLKSDAVSLLPDYAPCGGICWAFYDLTADEFTFTLVRIKWQLVHRPTGTCYLKVWLRKRFRPLGTSGGSDIITGDFNIYEWAPSANPCVDPLTIYNSAEILGSSGDEGEPNQNGSMFIEIDRWSCVPGYDPKTGGGTNGFPPDPV